MTQIAAFLTLTVPGGFRQPPGPQIQGCALRVEWGGAGLLLQWPAQRPDSNSATGHPLPPWIYYLLLWGGLPLSIPYLLPAFPGGFSVSFMIWGSCLYGSHWWSQNFSAQAWSVFAWKDWLGGHCLHSRIRVSGFWSQLCCMLPVWFWVYS